MAWVDVSKKIALGALVGLFALGCGSDPEDPEFAFGETEMQNAVVGDWTGTMTLSGQSPTTFTLSIARAPAMQPACGSRTFNSPLCIDTSSMSLDATLTTADKTFDAAKLQGTYMVIGLDLQYGELSLNGAGINFVSQFNPANASHDVAVSGGQSGTAVMQR